MNARRRIPLILGLTLLVCVCALIAFSRLVIMESFMRLEEEECGVNLRRTAAELQNGLDRLLSIAGDWAPWDETYYAVLRPGRQFIDDNLNNKTIENLGVDFMLFLDASRRMVYMAFPESLASRGIPSPVADVPGILSHPELFSSGSLEKGLAGFADPGFRPVMVASHPIIRSDFTGPAAGTLVVGKYLDDTEVERISATVHLDVKILRLDDPSLAPGVLQRLRRSAVSPPSAVVPRDELTVESFALFSDMAGRDAFVIRVSQERAIYQEGLKTFIFLNFAALGIGAVISLIIVIFVSQNLLVPLDRLSRAVSSLEPGREDRGVGFTGRRDELGILARAINGMLVQIAENRRKLLEQTYALGRAETASEVLHNVRNSLSTMVGEMEILSGRLSAVPERELRMAHEEIGAPGTPEGRRAALGEFLIAASRDLAALAGEARERLGSMGAKTAEIEEFLNAHEQWAREKPELESVRIMDALREALGALDPAGRRLITLETEIGPDASVRANGLILRRAFQIIFGCAAGAARRGGAGDGAVGVSVSAEGNGPDGSLRVSLRNPAVPFNAEAARTMFARGEKTGMHWCANALASMGAVISMESGGDGGGSILHVHFPQ